VIPIARGGARALTLAVALAALAACTQDENGKPTTPKAGPLPPGTEPIAATSRFPAPQRTANCYAAPIRIVFHSKMEWDAFWSDDRRGCTAPPVPPVDFQKEMLVFAAIGKRPSPQDSIAIDGAGVRNDTLIVAIRRWMLADGCPGDQAKGPVFPTSLVKIPADTAHPLRFSEEHRKITCDEAATAKP
jgi:hypothetical protein